MMKTVKEIASKLHGTNRTPRARVLRQIRLGQLSGRTGRKLKEPYVSEEAIQQANRLR